MGKIEFKLPDIGEGVAEGEITKWLVSEGDSVSEDQPMLEVMTDKATVEIGSPVDGTIQSIKAGEGDTVPVGDVIVVLSDEAGGGDDEAQQQAGSKGAAKDDGGDDDDQAGDEGDQADDEGDQADDEERASKKAKQGSGAQAERRDDADDEDESDDDGADDDDDSDDDASGDGEQINFSLPDVGEGVAEGEITKWLVSEGDSVTEDQPMLEVMTDKATVEIGSPVDGKVLEILHEEGDTVPVGDTLLVLTTGTGGGKSKAKGKGERKKQEKSEKSEKKSEDESGKKSEKKSGKQDDDDSKRSRKTSDDEGDEQQREAKSGGKGRQDTAPAGHGGRTSTGGTRARSDDDGGGVATAPRASTLSDTGLADRKDGTRRVRAAPAVRRYARESGVDISGLEGSGPNGRVTMDDVRKARSGDGAAPSRAPARPAAQPAAVQAPEPARLEGDERVPLRGLRKVIARQMRVAKQTAAHFSYVEEIDVTDLVALRKESKPLAEEKGVKLSYMPYIIKATCMALREFPILNASLDEEAQELVYHHEINMGVAVDTPNGLVVPVIRNADRNSMLENSRVMNELADRARNGKTQQSDIGGGTFTITNAGNIGGLLATPVINVPEVAILGVHKISRRPWVVDDQIVIRDIMYLSLSLDHRVVDGAVGAYFMNRVKELLEQPGLMLLES